MGIPNTNTSKFLSTLSLRRATSQGDLLQYQDTYFYPRSPCGERRWYGQQFRPSWIISIHALLAESDHGRHRVFCRALQFLSTLSLRRATFQLVGGVAGRVVFLSTLSLRRATTAISAPKKSQKFLSTLSLRRATADNAAREEEHSSISIHALLAESDLCLSNRKKWHNNFYPRSPCGERQLTSLLLPKNRHVYPRSPCGERLTAQKSPKTA